jgi:hypothetical protein
MTSPSNKIVVDEPVDGDDDSTCDTHQTGIHHTNQHTPNVIPTEQNGKEQIQHSEIINKTKGTCGTKPVYTGLQILERRDDKWQEYYFMGLNTLASASDFTRCGNKNPMGIIYTRSNEVQINSLLHWLGISNKQLEQHVVVIQECMLVYGATTLCIRSLLPYYREGDLNEHLMTTDGVMILVHMYIELLFHSDHYNRMIELLLGQSILQGFIESIPGAPRYISVFARWHRLMYKGFLFRHILKPPAGKNNMFSSLTKRIRYSNHDGPGIKKKRKQRNVDNELRYSRHDLLDINHHHIIFATTDVACIIFQYIGSRVDISNLAMYLPLARRAILSLQSPNRLKREFPAVTHAKYLSPETADTCPPIHNNHGYETDCLNCKKKNNYEKLLRKGAATDITRHKDVFADEKVDIQLQTGPMTDADMDDESDGIYEFDFADEKVDIQTQTGPMTDAGMDDESDGDYDSDGAYYNADGDQYEIDNNVYLILGLCDPCRDHYFVSRDKVRHLLPNFDRMPYINCSKGEDDLEEDYYFKADIIRALKLMSRDTVILCDNNIDEHWLAHNSLPKPYIFKREPVKVFRGRDYGLLLSLHHNLATLQFSMAVYGMLRTCHDLCVQMNEHTYLLEVVPRDNKHRISESSLVAIHRFLGLQANLIHNENQFVGAVMMVTKYRICNSSIFDNNIILKILSDLCNNLYNRIEPSNGILYHRQITSTCKYSYNIQHDEDLLP